ncbi:MAG: integrase, partial [bacterium]|nr:integrase [bacterium]
RRMLANWRDTLLIVKPETVIKWHRKGWKYYWHRKSMQGTPGRPKIDPEVIELIRRMSRDNVTWGAPRIHSELALLGHDVAESTVDKYMVRHPRQPSQGWRTFIANHMSVTAACDFFVVPTLTFKSLYCFVVLSHDRRKILHVNVTRHPTDEWTAQQIREAFPGDGFVPQYLHRDRDS